MDEISSTSYVAAHIAVIAFHVFIGLFVLYSIKRKQYDWVKYSMYVLIVVSVLGIIPIAMDTTPTVV